MVTATAQKNKELVWFCAQCIWAIGICMELFLDPKDGGRVFVRTSGQCYTQAAIVLAFVYYFRSIALEHHINEFDIRDCSGQIMERLKVVMASTDFVRRKSWKSMQMRMRGYRLSKDCGRKGRREPRSQIGICVCSLDWPIRLLVAESRAGTI
jgi:hypothetical protein